MHCNFTSKALGKGTCQCRFVNYAKIQTVGLGIVGTDGIDSAGIMWYAEGRYSHARPRRLQLWLLRPW
jgi:hypothetical protein